MSQPKCIGEMNDDEKSPCWIIGDICLDCPEKTECYEKALELGNILPEKAYEGHYEDGMIRE